MTSTSNIRIDYVNILRTQLNHSNLFIESSKHIAYLSRLEIIGRKIWNDTIQQNVNSSICTNLIHQSSIDDISLKNSITRVLGFGYEITYQLSSALIPEYSILKNGAVDGSILNFAISFYDMLYDELNRPNEVDHLITAKYITNALIGSFHFDDFSRGREDVYIEFFKRLVETLFFRWQLLVNKSFNPVVIHDFHYSMVRTYLCHKALRKNPNQIQGNLSLYYSWMKSCLPTWMMTELGILNQGYHIPNENNLQKMKKLIFHFAEILWLIDDLVDIFDDAERNQFNIFLSPMGIRHSTIYQQDLEKIAQKGMYEINNKILTLEQLFDPKSCSNLFRMIRCIIRSWIA